MNSPAKVFLLYHLPPWLWGGAIFIGTSLPTDYLPQVILLSPDKLLHIGAFMGLFVLIYRSLTFRRHADSGQTNIRTTQVITIAYAVFDELHQYLIPGRTPDIFDIVADGIGIGLGMLAVSIYNKMVLDKRKSVEPAGRHSAIS